MMQGYRLERRGRARGGRLSQSGLLDLMAEIREEYRDYSHSTVARWESGEILPSRERLEVFGAALELPRAEIDGLIALAGLDDRSPGVVEERTQEAVEVVATPSAFRGSPVGRSADGKASPSHAWEAARFLTWKLLIPGLGIGGAGYFLLAVGWSADWIVTAYIVVAICAMLSHFFLSLRRSSGMRDFLFVSVFVLLSTPMLQAPLMRMDHFGFFAIEGFGGTPIPYVLAMLVNLVLAFMAGLIYELMDRWQISRGETNPYLRAAWVSFPPLAFVYVCMLFITGVGPWLYLLEALPILGGVLMATQVLRNDSVRITSWAKRFLLQITFAIIIVLTAMSLAGMVVIYWDPSHQFVTDQTLVRSWEVDFNQLGYSEEEFVDRARVSTVWSSLGAILYMVVVVGGNLVVTIIRKGTSDSAEQAPSSAETSIPPLSAEGPRKRKRREPRVKVRYRPGWLAGHPAPQPVRSGAWYIPP